MESLFTTVRNMTLTDSVTDGDAEHIRHLVDSLRQPLSETSGQRVCENRIRPGTQKKAANRLEADSDVMQHELQTAKELMQKRLKRHAWRA